MNWASRSGCAGGPRSSWRCPAGCTRAFFNKPAHRAATDLMSGRGQFIGQVRRRLRGPPQRRLRMPLCLPGDELLQRRRQARVDHLRGRATSTQPPAPARPGPTPDIQLTRTPRHGVRLRLGRNGYQLLPAVPDRPGLGPQQQPPSPLIQERLLISANRAAIRSCSATVIDIPQRYRLVPDTPRQFSGEPLALHHPLLRRSPPPGQPAAAGPAMDRFAAPHRR